LNIPFLRILLLLIIVRSIVLLQTIHSIFAHSLSIQLFSLSMYRKSLFYIYLLYIFEVFIISQSIPVQREVHMHYTNKQLTMLMSNTLINYLPPSLALIIVLCIGTDRSTGDSLGPLTGTLLSNKQP